MSAKNQFDWIAFYEEFADKLLAYKDNRQDLIEKIKQVYEVTGIKLPTLERNENGDNEIIDIDPFTTFGLFNKQITDENRIKIITEIKELFSINSDIPTSFDGIPVLMLMYGKEASNRKQEIDRQHYTIPNQRPKDKHCGKI